MQWNRKLAINLSCFFFIANMELSLLYYYVIMYVIECLMAKDQQILNKKTEREKKNKS